MMPILRFLLGLAFAAGLYAAGLRLDPRFAVVVDPFLVLAVITALRASEAQSAVAGSLIGLVQDALTGGPFGLHGFTNTLVAWLATVARQRFVVQQSFQIGMLCLLAAALQQAMLALLRLSMLPASEPPDLLDTAAKMATTAVLGAFFNQASGAVAGWDRRRRESRRRRLRLKI